MVVGNSNRSPSRHSVRNCVTKWLTRIPDSGGRLFGMYCLAQHMIDIRTATEEESMAKKVVVQLVDDIDQQPIEDDGEHITFAVDGTDYEIDLGPHNAAEFRRTIGYYVDYAAKVTSASPTARKASKSSGRRSPEETKAVREWAVASGFDVSARGRIPSEVQTAYDAAH